MSTKIRKLWLCLILLVGISTNVYGESFTAGKVKGILENQFSKVLNKKVEIGELSGNLYKQVNLKDVKIYENDLTKEIFFYAEKIEVFYSLKRIILNQGNILENITLVNIDKPWVKVNRNSQGDFDIFDFKNEQQTENIPFSDKVRIKVKINNGKSYYSDQRGWGERPLNKIFVKELKNINGNIQIKGENLLFQVTAQLPVEKKYSTLNIQGEKNLVNALFTMSLDINDLNLQEWANYSAPMPDIFIAHDGIADLKINLQQLKNNHLDYKILLNLKNTVLDLPIILNKRLFKGSGQLTINNDSLEFKNLKALLDNHIVATLNGKLVNFENPTIDLLIDTNFLPLHQLSRYLKDVPNLPVEGQVKARLKLNGLAQNPRVKGSFSSGQAELLSFKVTKINGQIDFYQTNLFLDITDSILFAGEAKLSGNIDIKDPINPHFDLTAQLKNSQAIKVFNFDNFTGDFSGKIKIKGALNDLLISAGSSSANLCLFEQQLSNFKLTVNKKNDDFIFENCLITNNNLSTIINGQIKNYQFFNFKISDNKFIYQNYQLENNPVEVSGMISVNLTGDFQDFNSLESSGELTIQDSNIFGENNISANINFSSKANKLNIKKCLLKKNTNRLILDGYLTDKNFDFNIRKNSTLNPSSLNLLKKSIPGTNISANISLVGNIKKDTDLGLLIDFETKDQLINDNIKIDKVQGTVTLEKGNIYLKRINIKNNYEQYQLDGYFPVKKDLSLQDNILLKINCTDAQIKSIDQFYKMISKIICLSQISQQQPNKLNYEISFDNSTSLYLKNSSSGVLNKYQLYKSTIETIDLFNQALLPEGTINGDLSFSLDNHNFIINSNLEINNFSYGAIQAKNILFNFETKNNIVDFKAKINNLSNQYNNFPKTEIAGIFENGYLKINDFNILVDDKKYQNIITGQFPLSAYWDSTAINNKIDLSFNFPQNSISLLSLISRTKEISHQGNFYLKIDGSFQNPLISHGDFNINNFKIEFPGIKEVLQIKTGKVTIVDNFIDVQQINSLYFDPKKEKNSIGLITEGTALFKELSLSNLQSNKFFIDLQTKNTGGNININNLYQGKIDLNNFSLKGDYSTITTDIKLSGNILLEDGIVFLPNLDNSEQTSSNILLDLNINFNRNVTIRQGRELLSGDLSKIIGEINIFIDPKNSQMRIDGPLSNLNFNGNINFSEGLIKFLNRDFYFINKDTQQSYLKNYPEKIRQNELVMDSHAPEQFTFHLRSETIILEETATTQNTEVTQNKTIIKETEKRFVFLIDGPLNNLSSFTFIGYNVKNNTLTEVGTPYYLIDPKSDKLLEDNRFQQLVYELAPSFLKNPSQDTGKELARDIFYSEINQYFKTLIRPYEKMLAKQTGLYDVRVKGDFAQQTVKLLQTQANTYYNKLALELVYELYKEKLFFTLDTSLDQLNYYKITWYILTKKYIDELSANFGNKYDYYQKSYTPMFSLEINDVF